jgi:UvrD-like helicase C-terminal domain
MEALKAHLTDRPLIEGEAVLGLTYMHGSRRRMHNRLASVSALRGRFIACTVDSLARQLVCRWRTMAKNLEPGLDLGGSADFGGICRAAALLLRRDSVSGWLRIRYPMVVADELQDCRGDRLCIIQGIESHCHVIAAADEFQDLQPEGTNVAVDWLHGSQGKKVVLTGNRRTKTTVLLQAAGRLRAAQDCGDILGNALLLGRNANAAAGGIARTLYWKKSKDVAILTPTGPEKSPFVREVITRLTSKPITPQGIPTAVGPFRIVWESNVEEEKHAVIDRLGSLANGATLQGLRTIVSGDSGALADLFQWAERKFRVRGQAQFSAGEISLAIDRILHSRRAFIPTGHPGIVRAMTINQAKNREFEGVIVLWPFAVAGDIESQRRRLYNGLTRAQKWAVVMVQENTKGPSRLSLPPFSKTLKPAPAVAAPLPA